MRKSIILFWGECDSYNYHWYHLTKRYVHTSVIVCADDFTVSLCPSSKGFIRIFKDYVDFWQLYKSLSALKSQGCTEVVAVESSLDYVYVGGWPWYNCQSFVRDMAAIDCGFVANPWHLSAKIKKTNSKNFKVLARKIL